MKVASIQIQANDLCDYKSAADKLIRMIEQAAKTHDLIIVPECAFPAYYLDDREANLQLILEKNRLLLNEIKTIARTNHSYIAYGYAEEDGGCLYNTALLIDRNGNEAVKKRKSYLWHFDHLWFSEGQDLAIANTDFGKVGLVICCDARSPEVVRLAALAGADLIIDLANLTATGPDIAELHNAQSAYMLSVRALENGVWLAMADKWGVETNSIVYTGRSAVYDPDGTCHYQAGSDADEIVSVEIPNDSDGRIIRKTKVPLPKRRPDLYGILTEPVESLPIAKVIERPAVISEITPYITTVAGELTSNEYVDMIRRLSVHGSQLICMPPSNLAIEELSDGICGGISNDGMIIATMLENGITKSYIFNKHGLISSYENAHKNGGKAFILQTAWGNIGILHEEEGLLPEWSRTLMLLGADCLIWPNSLTPSIATPVARTRAAENRVFVVVAQACAAPSLSQIIDPNGAVIASTLQNQAKQACGTYACFANSRMKSLVPGTHVVFDRHPEAYRRLTIDE